jgi:hypothetical protein
MCARFAGMDKEEWMYQTSRLDLSYLDHVRKFVATAKKHRLSLKKPRNICPCNRCQNKLTQEDDVTWSSMVSSRIHHVWRFHGEADPSVGAYGGNSLTSTAMVNGGVPVHLEETCRRRWRWRSRSECPYIRLLARNKQKKGTRISKAYCDSKWRYLFFYTLNIHVKFVVDTSDFCAVLTRSTCKIPKKKNGIKLKLRRKLSVRIKSRLYYYTVHALYMF